MGKLEGKTVLLVEDEPIVAMLVEDMLAGLGAQVVGPAARVEEAIALVGSTRLDAAVLDVKLGSSSSEQVAKALRARAVPYVLATGFDAPQNGQDAAVPLLQKPYLQDDLERALLAALALAPSETAGHG